MFCLHLAPKSTAVYWFNWTLACHQQKQVGTNSSSVFLSYVLAILAFKALPASFNRLQQQSISRRASRSSVDSPVLIKMSLVLLGWVFHGIPVLRIINKLSQWILILLPILHHPAWCWRRRTSSSVRPELITFSTTTSFSTILHFNPNKCSVALPRNEYYMALVDTSNTNSTHRPRGLPKPRIT